MRRAVWATTLVLVPISEERLVRIAPGSRANRKLEESGLQDYTQVPVWRPTVSCPSNM